VAIEGEDLAAEDLDAIKIVNSRDLWWFPGFRGSVEIAYEAGLDRPPAGAASAALALVEQSLSPTGIDPRARTLRTDAGTLELARDADEFGIPEVDRFVRRERRVDMSLA
jgi:hypothetical protein